MQPLNGIVASAAFATVLVIGSAFGPNNTAQAVTLINGSFESGAADPGAFTTLSVGDNTSITGWTVSAGTIDYVGTYWVASDGSRSLDMNGLSTGSISQTITGLTTGTQYRVSFDLAGNTDAGPTIKTLDAVTASAGTNSYNFDITGHSRSSMGWLTESFLFTATGASELLTFASTVLAGGTLENPAAFGPALDNVTITATTPLPAAMPLFAGAAGLLWSLARRRKQKAATVAA